MANDPFSPKKRFSLGRVVTGLVLIFSATFAVAYYAPLTEAHSALAKEHETLSSNQRNVSSQLKLTTEQLEAAQKERDGLYAKLTAIDKAGEEEKAKASGLFESISSELKSRVARKDLQVVQEGSQTVVVVDDLKLFRGHQVFVHPPGRVVLCAVAKAVKEQELNVEIVSHAASEKIENPILSGDYPTTWDLTAARAAGAAQALARCGVKPELLAASGVGHYRPINDAPKTSTGQVRLVISQP